MQTFPINDVNAIRTAATAACDEPTDAPIGWSVSQADPMQLLAAFPALSIRPGWVLRAYVLNVGIGGRGLVWALPAETLPTGTAVPYLDGEEAEEPPRPAEALDDVMEAIEGDGSAWSYLSASLLAREVEEFGAVWHGCRWSTHVILGDDPWQCDREQCDKSAQDFRERQPLAMSERGSWTWLAAEPQV